MTDIKSDLTIYYYFENTNNIQLKNDILYLFNKAISSIMTHKNIKFEINVNKPNIVFFTTDSNLLHFNNYNDNVMKVLFIDKPIDPKLEKFKQFSNILLLIDSFDFTISYHPILNVKYARLPIYLFNIFVHNFKENIEFIEKNSMNFNDRILFNNTDDNKFCILNADHDKNFMYKHIFNIINKIDTIDCTGKLFHNCNRNIHTKYNFNICPEDINLPGYISNNLWNCVLNYDVPIFSGGVTQTEFHIFNPTRILLYDTLSNVSLERIAKQIIEFKNDNKYFLDFYNQPIFGKLAAPYIKHYIFYILYNIATRILDKLGLVNLKEIEQNILQTQNLDNMINYADNIEQQLLNGMSLEEIEQSEKIEKDKSINNNEQIIEISNKIDN